MAITVDVREHREASPCGHARISITVGAKTHVFVIEKSRLMQSSSDLEVEDSVVFLLRALARAAGVTTWAALKTKFTNLEVSL